MTPSILECFYRVSIKALITDAEWRFLLCKEDNGMRELPGWWLDFGENPYDCLTREIREELWLSILSVADQPLYFYPFVNLNRVYYHKDFYAINIVYPVTVQDIKFNPSEECREIKFFTAEEALWIDNTYINVKEFAKLYSHKI